MDRPLDDRIADRQPRNRGPPPPRRGRPTYPRDGVRKPARDDRANLDNDWVHDRYDDEPSPRDGYSARPRGRRDDRDERRSPEKDRAPPPAKLRVDNLHWDLTEDDLYDLFTRIAAVKEVKLTYDRAGRSDGTAFVTYDLVADARTAIREFDGANAKGQPIRLTLLPLPPRTAPRRENPFDRVEQPVRSLIDRVDTPTGRGRRRSESPNMNDRDSSGRGGRRGAPRGDRRSDTTRPVPENIDRYIPGQNGRSSSHREGGRRPGERRERVPREPGTRGAARPKKTAEELDAEMEDYWGGANAVAPSQEASASTAPAGAATTAATDDIDMIE